MPGHTFTVGDYVVLDRSMRESPGEVYRVTATDQLTHTGTPLMDGLPLQADAAAWRPAPAPLVAAAQRMAAGHHQIGDLVVLGTHWGRRADRLTVFRVTAIDHPNTTLTVTSVVGARTTSAPFEAWRPAPDDLTAAATTRAASTSVDPGAIVEGVVVTISGRGWKEPAGQRYVVTRRTNDEHVRVAKLGGDNGRFWQKIPIQALTIVDLDATP